jgi:glycosyltransferase involved in cell wall biosynthesis
MRPGLVRTLRNGIVVPERRPGGGDRDRLRTELGVGPGDRAIATVGRLDEPKKGLAVLLRAVARLARDMQGMDGGPSFRLVMVGEGPARQALEALTRAHEIGHLVRFAGERRDVGDLLPAFDLFAQPSLWEGFGVTVLEAMAAGLPVVASRVGGIPEIVRDGETGLLVPAGDADALAAALLRLLEDPGLAALMGRAGRARLEEQFGIDRMVDETAALYRELLSRRRRAGPGAAARGGGGS